MYYKRELNSFRKSYNTTKNMEELENKIIETLNEADKVLTKSEFESLAESIIDYIDQIARAKRRN